ncbi:MAG: calcium-binding protein [Rhizobiales bacterium]|nr:calcium-binding protein [Hyphomicrobiales bacterium]
MTAALDGSLTGTGDAKGDTFVGIERLRGTNFDDCLKGDAASNILFGQSGRDILDGGSGADRIIGGTSIDTLTGGAGADRFEFMALNEVGDLILDFSAADDLFVITGSAFGGGLTAGTLSANQFQSSANTAAANAAVRFIFNTSNKTLWFDSDGSAAAGAVMLAELQATAIVTHADILIV